MGIKLENLKDELLAVENEIEVYLEDLQEQKDNLLSSDLEDEFDGSILVGAAENLKVLGEKRKMLLSQILKLK